MEHEDCKLHVPLQNAILNTEIQYGKIQTDLADIKDAIGEIKTKLAIIDSHDIINKVSKMEGTLTAATASVGSNQNWFKITMALIMILGGLVGIKIAL